MNCQHCQSSMTGRKRKYCDKTCMGRAQYARTVADGRAAEYKRLYRSRHPSPDRTQRKRAQRECIICSSDFDYRAGDPTRTCSPKCRAALHTITVRPTCSVKFVRCPSCLIPRGTSHYLGPLYHPSCRPPDRRQYRFPPKVKKAVYERDNGTCWLCLSPVEQHHHPNADQAPSLDHVVPRSRGGSHDIDNLRLAHRICNSIRQDNPPTTPGPPFLQAIGRL
jgi:5-methylcytosine-specific restriction endonuclease McrA